MNQNCLFILIALHAVAAYGEAAKSVQQFDRCYDSIENHQSDELQSLRACLKDPTFSQNQKRFMLRKGRVRFDYGTRVVAECDQILDPKLSSSAGRMNAVRINLEVDRRGRYAVEERGAFDRDLSNQEQELLRTNPHHGSLDLTPSCMDEPGTCVRKGSLLKIQMVLNGDGKFYYFATYDFAKKRLHIKYRENVFLTLSNNTLDPFTRTRFDVLLQCNSVDELYWD